MNFGEFKPVLIEEVLVFHHRYFETFLQLDLRSLKYMLFLKEESRLLRPLLLFYIVVFLHYSLIWAWLSAPKIILHCYAELASPYQQSGSYWFNIALRLFVFGKAFFNQKMRMTVSVALSLMYLEKHLIRYTPAHLIRYTPVQNKNKNDTSI